MKYPLWKPLLIVAVLGLFGWMISLKGLRPGLDLAGGATLIYDVKIPKKSDAAQVIDDMINVLRDRVDPTGTRNLVWRRLAGNRMEIQMALATSQVKDLREAYDLARKALEEGNLSRSAVEAALRLEGNTRASRLDELAAENESLRKALAKLGEAHDVLVDTTGPYREAQQVYREAEDKLEDFPEDTHSEQRDQDESALSQLLKVLVSNAQNYREAKDAYDTTLAEVLRSNVDASELQRALDQPLDPSRRNQTSRQQALDQLKESHPNRDEQIQAVAEAYAAYELVKGPLDDPNDLIALLQGSGVLEFRIAATPGDTSIDIESYRQQLKQRGPRGGADQPWRWFVIDDIKQFVDEPASRRLFAEDPQQFFESIGLIGQTYGDADYLLLANAPDQVMTRDQTWELRAAALGSDGTGRPAVNFTLDTLGGDLMAQITGPNVGKPMAILLDNMAISAPNLRGRIADRGQITGNFSQPEVNYLLRTLKAGSTEAELGDYPISSKFTGPKLGQDNLNAGFAAAKWALIAVAIFMVFYYLVSGLIADFALLANMIIILGVMAIFEVTFTLPGIAGIVLTIGMAVDANVLIFERIREESGHRADLATAIRIGYQKALSTIIDANLTTLITCVVLFYTATAEVKGFATTLMIGIVATLFTSLFCTRVILDLYLIWGKAKSLPMLPTLVPVIGRVLSPNLNWVGKRYAFFTLSAAVIIAGVWTVYSRGQDLLDIEFRAGTKVSFNLADGQTMSIERVRQTVGTFGTIGAQMRRPQFDPSALTAEQRAVYDRLKPIVEVSDQRFELAVAEAAVLKEQDKDPGEVPTARVDFGLLSQATVVTVGKTVGTEANEFSIATLITDPLAVSAVIKAAFADKLDTTRPIDFRLIAEDRLSTAPVYPVRVPNLGENINRPDVHEEVPDFLGGVAVVLDELDPATTIADLDQRIHRMRRQPGYESLSGRQFRLIGIDQSAAVSSPASPTFRSVVVLTSDGETNYAETPETFTESGGLADTEWALVRDALQRDTSLGSVSNFSSQVSAAMKKQAFAAIGLSLLAVVAYIWFRFGSFRYGLAAIVALVHDVCIALGLVAVVGMIFKMLPDSPLTKALLLTDFKIDLALVAALLTIIGYSLNDTIVVFDRIRENRGRLSHVTPAIINDSINQTISRTVLTSGTTLLAVGVLYIFGGPGVHGFAFAMLVGVLIGTYSSIAIAAPVLLIRAAVARSPGHKELAPTERSTA